MKRELPEKCCKTCQHYVPHYTRSARGVYHQIGRAHV